MYTPTPLYDKINEEDLVDRIEKSKANCFKAIHNKLVKIERTKIVNEYLTIVNEEYIKNKIADAIANNHRIIVLKREMIDYHNFPENIDRFRHVPQIDRDDICDSKLCDLDINHDQLIGQNLDLTKSILEMIEDIVPNDYRVYSLYGLTESNGLRRRYDVTLRRGSYCCNDPCCFILCCKNRSIFQSWWCLGNNDDDCPCCDCYCCCGH